MPQIAFHFNEDHTTFCVAQPAVERVFTEMLRVEPTIRSPVSMGTLLFEKLVAIRESRADGSAVERYPAEPLARVYASWLLPDGGMWTNDTNEAFRHRRTWALFFRDISTEAGAVIHQGFLDRPMACYIGALEIRPEMPFYSLYDEYLVKAFAVDGRRLTILGSPNDPPIAQQRAMEKLGFDGVDLHLAHFH